VSSSVIGKIVTTLLGRTRTNVFPGDIACIDPNFIVGGDIPLLSQTATQALEREAFTGHSDNTVTGWIRKGQIVLVVGVYEDQAYIWAREGEGRGWIALGTLRNINDFKTEATETIARGCSCG
jgi:hypothetical protein